MDQFPTEIIKLWLSFLDDKSARIARLVCTDWFKWIKYSIFHIRFARPDSLPQIVARLSTYQYPISLTLSKTFKMPFEAMANEISKLTQLRSFNLINNSKSSRFIPTSQYYPLTTLSNLEELYIEDGTVPAEILQHFPRIRRTRMDLVHEFFPIIPKICTKIESLCIYNFAAVDLVPLSVEELDIHHHVDEKIDWIPLARLTNLKKLRVTCDIPQGIDVSHITWLEELKLMMNLDRIDGLERCNNLTNLRIESEVDVPQFMAPPNLEILAVESRTQSEFSFESFSHLTRLTSLDIECTSALLRTLGTSLQWLRLHVKTPHNMMDITHLIHLTRLDTVTENNPLYPHAITSLTNLRNLNMNQYSGSGFQQHFNGLINLTRLCLSGIEVDTDSFKHLTNLQEFEFLGASLSSEQWQSLNRARNLRVLQMFPRNKKRAKAIKYDYTTIDGLPRVNIFFVGPKENEWQIVTKLTDLQDLQVDLTDDNDLKSLTALSNLTSLRVLRPKGYTNVVGLYLTMLTNLQSVNMPNMTPRYLDEDLASRMTRLYDFDYDHSEGPFAD